MNYIVADQGIDVAGTPIEQPEIRNVIKQDQYGFPIHKVVLRQAPWRLLRIGQPLRLRSAAVGVEADGWITPPPGAPRNAPAFSAYNQFSTPGERAGFVRVTVSRAAWGGRDKPGRVTITAGRLVRGKDLQPAMGRVFSVRHWVVHARQTRVFTFRITRIEIRVSPTFSPHDFGGSDRRLLGAQVSFGFSPTRPAG